MKESHGRGRRVGRIGLRALGWAALVAASGGVGPARAGQIAPKPATNPTTPTIQVVDALDPTSLAPPPPPLTSTAAPAGGATASAPIPVVLPLPVPLTPSPLANPPAAEGAVPTVAPPAVSSFGAPSPSIAAPACSCTCPNVPINPPPVVSNPPSGPAPLQPASPPPNAPEPASIVSALAMVGAAVAWRRRARRAG